VIYVCTHENPGSAVPETPKFSHILRKRRKEKKRQKATAKEDDSHGTCTSGAALSS